GFIRYSHLLLAPINPTIFGNPVAQMTGLITTGLLLAGLIRYGSAHSRILAVALVWVLLMLVPVLNLPVESGDLESNRFLYLPAAGYCVVVAILLHSAVLSIRQGRLAVAVVGLLVFISIIICWVQLRPWHTATVQAEALEQD